jgi:HPt (histidine-containing phosphotransfer) domain-containing protein
MGVALRTVAGDAALLAELAAIFAGDAPLRVAALEAAVASGDGLRARDEAHALKGAAASLGAVRVQGLAADIEARAGDGSREGLRDLVAALAREVARAVALLAELPGAVLRDGPAPAGEAGPGP